jgi:hypothetical protein
MTRLAVMGYYNSKIMKEWAMKKIFVLFFIYMFLSGCVIIPSPSPSPEWNSTTTVTEAEYIPYLKVGTGTVAGQAFLVQKGGNVVKAAGRSVTLDPATSVGKEWWYKAGVFWVHRSLIPHSPGFQRARRTTIADAEGRFKFYKLPAGKYYVRTEVTWEIGDYPTQGGLVGQLVDVLDRQTTEVILNQYPSIEPPQAIIQKDTTTEKLKFGIKFVKTNTASAKILGMKEPQGVIVVSVAQDSIAFRAGLKQGQAILKYGETEINDVVDLQAAIAATDPGSIIPITIWAIYRGEIVITAEFPE